MGFDDPLFPARLQECHLLVNSTSVGLSRGDPPLFDYCLLPSRLLVYDLIYDPELTPLLRAAQERGCSTFNGLGMLVYQGALSFEIWTQRPPPVEKMREAVKAIR
jgi:shikimate dehydrogenase